MVAVYAIASLSAALAAGFVSFPSMGGWAIAIAWIAANAAGAGVALMHSAGRRRRDAAATDRMVADLRSVLAAAQPRDGVVGAVTRTDRRVA